MIIIHQPYIYSNKNKMRVEAMVQNQKACTEEKIWYEVEAEYGEYLCDELADAFLLAMLPVAAYSEQNIQVHSNISPQLLGEIKHTHIPLYAEFFQNNQIEVDADESVSIEFCGEAVATGGSLGVDSLSTIYQHLEPGDGRLTHLALFNSGQIGNSNQDDLDQAFETACHKTLEFANETGLGFIGVNSNISTLYSAAGMELTYLFHYSTISCVMALQKFFGTYYLASSYRAEFAHMDHTDISYYESWFVSKLGNNNVNIVLSDADVSRVEKTRMIADKPLTAKYIDVCWADEVYNSIGGRKYYHEGKINRNCGWCDKCMRTLFTMELLGHLPEYTEAFDMDKYYLHRKDFIIKVVSNAKYNQFYEEIYNLMKDSSVSIPRIAYVVRALNVKKDSKLIYSMWNAYKTIKRKVRH